MKLLLLLSIFINNCNSIPYPLNTQVLIMDLYNDTNCSVLLSNEKYDDSCNDYDECCKKLLKKYEMYPDQDINVCYNKTNSSYKYECLYKDKNIGNIGIIVFYSFFGLLVLLIILYIYDKCYKCRKIKYNKIAKVGNNSKEKTRENAALSLLCHRY